MSTTPHEGVDRDAADLAGFGYRQELKRELNTFSSFAIAFSYISPATGIFTLYYLALTIGGLMFWTWPVVAVGQLFVALNFAELSSHYPIAGSVYQWTKYVAGRGYAWITGWIYLFAGIITVAAVCATLPLALIPLFNGIGIDIENTIPNARWIAIVTLVIITVLNIYGVRLVSIVNNTGVLFEILGLVVFAIILGVAHNEQGLDVIFDSAGQTVNASSFLVAMFMSLFVIYGFDTQRRLEIRVLRRPRQCSVRSSGRSWSERCSCGGRSWPSQTCREPQRAWQPSQAM